MKINTFKAATEIQRPVSYEQINSENFMDMIHLFAPLGVLVTIGYTVVAFTKVLVDYRLKNKMIDKGMVSEEVQGLLKKHASRDKLSSLKWGLIIFFAGLSLILIDTINADADSPLPYGIFTVAVSVGFLIYYFITKDKE